MARTKWRVEVTEDDGTMHSDEYRSQSAAYDDVVELYDQVEAGDVSLAGIRVLFDEADGFGWKLFETFQGGA